MQGRYNVLFLCTGNSARSIMAEAIMNQKGKPTFTAYSAGSYPAGTVRPEALKQLEAAHVPKADLRSKSWDEFAKPGAPKLDFVFTVCDNGSKERCAVWPGPPLTLPVFLHYRASPSTNSRQKNKSTRSASNAPAALAPGRVGVTRNSFSC